MIVRVYFCNEPDIPTFVSGQDKISRQALDSIYTLVWECEFKNILNVGRIWIKFKHEKNPFGIALRNKRSHNKISPGDIIQLGNDFYMVQTVGAKKIELCD